MATTALITAHQAKTGTRSPLALWHLLSLDAPAVAAVWTMYAAHAFGVLLPWSAPAALALAVWMLYVADRMADAAGETELQERHRFHHRHRHALGGAVAGALPVLILFLVLLPHGLRTAWMLLALPLAAYVAAVHALRLRVPKELLVSIFFATTCFTPLLLVTHHAETCMAMLLFGALCWLNCAALARWEGAPRSTMDGCTAWAAMHLGAACFTLAATAGVMLFVSHARATALPVLGSSMALLLLERARTRMQPVHLRAMADAALLTPLLTLPLLHMLQR